MFNTSRPSRRIEALLCVLVVALFSGFAAQPVQAQDQTQAEQRQELLGDFMHFVLIDRPDIAAATGQSLLDSGISASAFVDLVDRMDRESGTSFFDVLGRADRRVELAPIAGKLRRMYEQGRLDRARDADEIAKNIVDLGGGNRAMTYARSRLKEAGEYAMPQLLEALLRGDNPLLAARVQRLMIDMRQHAVTPLSAALGSLEETEQERVSSILGQLGYPAATPALVELVANTDNEAVRWAAEQALTQLGQSGVGSANEAYYMLAEAYYGEREELTSFPDEPVQLLWEHSPATGLVPTPIATEVFHEAMAMRHASRSLSIDANGVRSLALWIAANFSREIDSPSGYNNPAYSASMREAMYYAVASGPVIGELVLARALEDRDTPLALQAIEAIGRTAGSGSLLELEGSQSPLVRSLAYPNRRVQYDAALALGGSQPVDGFQGADRVVPILASAIRFAGTRYAVVIADDREQYQARRATLEAEGFRVLPFASDEGTLESEMAAVPGIDFVLIERAPDGATRSLDRVRSSLATSAAPTLVITDNEGLAEMRRRYRGDESVLVRLRGIGADAVTASVATLMDRAAGGMTDASEAAAYAREAVLTLRDLAVGGNDVLDVQDASVSLIAAMDETEGEMRLAVADVLSRIPEPRAQQSVVQAAIDASGDERVSMLERASASAKRFGNLCEQRHLDAVLEVAITGQDDEATAAAAVLGAMKVPNSRLIPLITGS